MIVLTNEGNPNALKFIIAAKLVQENVTVKIILPNETPLGRLPVLELPTGSKIFSTSAGMQLLAAPSEEYEIITNKWLEWDASVLQPAITYYGTAGSYKIDLQDYLFGLLYEVDDALKEKMYLIKDKNDISLADASIWVSIWSTIIVTNIGNRILKEYSYLSDWLKNIELLPIIQDSLKVFPLKRGLNAIASIQAASWFPINSTRTSAIGLNSIKDKEAEVVSQEEMDKAMINWNSCNCPNVKETSYPVLPKKGERNILITSALPYVNNVPHLGNIVGCVLSADIFARYCRQRNYNTLYISGTDEYGTATEAKALEEKITPQEICDKFFSIHNDIYRWFGIGFDYFGRTTTTEQTEIVQSFFLKIKSQGYVLTDTVDQLLCESCDRFLADRFVEGICPRCKYEDARGDQCDGCGHLVNSTELINPRCKMCSNRPIIKKSKQFFLDLPKLEERLKVWSAKVEKGWSTVARGVTKPWLRDGLKPRCITRDLKWGIPVPVEGFENKVFYVWFDAPFGYISITKRYTKEYEQWWKPNGVDISLCQFMAKDNVPFHTIMFPAYLLATNEDYTLLKHLMAIEYLNYEDTKFSKSRGIGVFGTDARETGIPADVWRFYLAYIRPENQDSNFNWADLASKNNNELLNNLGNFINRALVFTEKFFDSKIPPMEPKEDDLTLLALAQRELTSYINALEQAKLRDGIKYVLAISKHGNQYMQLQQPWVKVKSVDDNDKKKAGTIIGICCNLTCLLSALLAPYMPNTSREIRGQLGLDKTQYGYIPDVIMNMLSPGHKIGKVSPLFTKIEDQLIEELREKYAGKQETNGAQSKTNNATESVESSKATAAQRGQLVKELVYNHDKSVRQSHVDILSRLQNKLADRKQNTDKCDNAQSAKNKKVESLHTPEQNGDTSTDITSLEAAIAKQGDLVRKLKAQEEKSVWQPQVDILLKLKNQLASLTGAKIPDKKSKKKSN